MNKVISFLTLICIISAIILFFVIAHYFGSAESVRSEKPIVICIPHDALIQKQQCFWTAHIHAMVKVFKNNKEEPIGYEQGKLEDVHTHAEKNKLHWHGLIAVDKKTRQVQDWSAFRIDTIPKALGISIQGNPRFIVNGQQQDPSYIWHDGDNIEIYYEK